MEELKRRKSPRLQGFDYNSKGAYFLTICTQNRRCMLSHVVGTGVHAVAPQLLRSVETGRPQPVGTGVLDCPCVELSLYGKIADKYINQLNDFYHNLSVDRYVIMPNHIHLLLFVRGDGQSRTPVPTKIGANSVVSRFVSTFKRFCNKEYGENIWQDRFNDHIIRNREDYEEHVRYIHENPTRWYYDELYSEE